MCAKHLYCQSGGCSDRRHPNCRCVTKTTWMRGMEIWSENSRDKGRNPPLVTREGIPLSRPTVTAFIQNRSKPPHQEIACDVSLKICKKQYLNRFQVMNLIEQVFKIQMGTRFRLLININQLVASVVEGATRASWMKWKLAWASSKLGVIWIHYLFEIIEKCCLQSSDLYFEEFRWKSLPSIAGRAFFQ